MTKRMHVQVVRQVVFLENQFEAPRECRRSYRLIQIVLSEQKVVVGYSPSLIVKSLALAVAAVLPFIIFFSLRRAT